MDEAGFRHWMDAYKGVYEGRDPDGAATLFTDDSTYQWGPFGGRRLLYAGVFAVALEGDLCRTSASGGTRARNRSADGGQARPQREGRRLPVVP